MKCAGVGRHAWDTRAVNNERVTR